VVELLPLFCNVHPVKPVASRLREVGEEGTQRARVSFAEGVDGVELAVIPGEALSIVSAARPRRWFSLLSSLKVV